MKFDIVKTGASLIVIFALLMCSSVATETTWRHSGFELWGYDINFTNMNASNVWVLDFEDNGIPSISNSDSGKLYYNDTDANILVSVNAGAYSEMQTADMKGVANGLVGLDGSSKIDQIYLPTTTSVISSGSYTGDDSVNRAIPHGLGVVPSLVMLMRDNHQAQFDIIEPGRIRYLDEGTSNKLTVTIPDATNFYVGNAASYDHSANKNTIVFHWVAFG